MSYGGSLNVSAVRNHENVKKEVDHPKTAADCPIWQQMLTLNEQVREQQKDEGRRSKVCLVFSPPPLNRRRMERGRIRVVRTITPEPD